MLAIVPKKLTYVNQNQDRNRKLNSPALRPLLSHNLLGKLFFCSANSMEFRKGFLHVKRLSALRDIAKVSYLDIYLNQ